MEHHHDRRDLLLGFVAGVVTTVAVTGYYLYGPQGRAHRRKVERWVIKARAEILDRIEDIESISEEQYNKIVDEVTRKYATLKQVSGAHAGKVADSFKRRREEMKAAAARARDEAMRDLENEFDPDEI